MEHLSKSLRGSKVNPLNTRRTESTSSGAMYQVNLYIEIDQSFITNSGGSMDTAVNYVNIMVTAANLVYEKEILTHLHVSYIEVTDLYDNANSPRDALLLMVSSRQGDAIDGFYVFISMNYLTITTATNTRQK